MLPKLINLIERLMAVFACVRADVSVAPLMHSQFQHRGKGLVADVQVRIYAFFIILEMVRHPPHLVGTIKSLRFEDVLSFFIFLLDELGHIFINDICYCLPRLTKLN